MFRKIFMVFALLALALGLAMPIYWFADQQSQPVSEGQAVVSEGQAVVSEGQAVVSEGHAAMVAELAELLETTQYPDDFTLNSKAVVYYGQLLESAQAEIDSLTDRIASTQSSGQQPDKEAQLSSLYGKIGMLQKEVEQSRGKHIYNMLVAGFPERALAEIDSLFDDRAILAGDRPPEFQNLEGLFELKAMMHFVIGERNNCQQNHNSRSCILPFHEDAFHIDPSGSKMAIKYLQLALEIDPKNPRTLWLYNLANMTLGQYPDAIPENLRIPFDKYDADLNFAHFPERASALGVNTKGYLGGANMEDFNGDGLLDLFTTSFKLGDNVRLYLNRGDQGFEDVTEQAGLSGITGGVNTVHADYNNDGNCDIFIIRGGWLQEGGRRPNSLLRNNGDETFTDVTQESGLLSYHPTHTAAWSDFNNDGHLDLFVGNECGSFEENESGSFVIGEKAADHFSELFLNNGDGTFSEVSRDLGISINQWVKGAVWADFDNDGWSDLYVSCFGAANLVFKNEGADGQGNVRFTEISKAIGLSEPIFSFPVACFDFNNDGFEDLFVAGYSTLDPELTTEYLGLAQARHPPCLYLNKGNWEFEEIAAQTGLQRTIFAMGLNFGDVNNDGFLDLYAATGHADLRSLFPNLMLVNDQGKAFLDVTTKAGCGHLQKGHAVAFGDADNDGDQDIYANVGGFAEFDFFWNAYFENPGFGHHWVNLKLEGESSNRSAIGAKLKLVIRENDTQREIHRVVSTGGSYGASSLAQEIGIGKATQIDSLSIHWPVSGRTQHFTNLEADRRYLIKESFTTPQVQPYERVNWSTESSEKSGSGHHHH